MFEIYHVGYAVRNLERALRDFHSALGGRLTEPQEFDMLVHHPLVSATPVRIHGRSAWLVGQPTPIEFWEGGPNTPWHLEESSSGLKLHHCCFWADDLDAAAERFEAIGFEREMTPVHDGPGLLGFCYLLHPSGSRVEIQSSVDKPSANKWIKSGTPKRLCWVQYTS